MKKCARIFSSYYQLQGFVLSFLAMQGDLENTKASIGVRL